MALRANVDMEKA